MAKVAIIAAMIMEFSTAVQMNVKRSVKPAVDEVFADEDIDEQDKAACDDVEEGAACFFKDKAKTIRGECEDVDEKGLVCMRNHVAKFQACDGLKDGDACSIEEKGKAASGTCDDKGEKGIKCKTWGWRTKSGSASGIGKNTTTDDADDADADADPAANDTNVTADANATNATELSETKVNASKFNLTAHRADRTRPRMLVSQGCDASGAIIRHAHFLLKLHDVSTPWRKINSLQEMGLSHSIPEDEGQDDDDEIDSVKSAASLAQFWPFSQSENLIASPPVEEKDDKVQKEGFSVEPRALSQEGEAASQMVLKMNEFYKNMNKSFVFKGILGKDMETILSKGLFDMGTLAVQAYRKNKIDQVICMVKDCTDNKKLGYPMKNGTQSDICWKRRAMNSSNLADYKAYIKTDTMLATMESLEGKALKAKNGLKELGYPIDNLLYTEDLLDFEWNNESVGAGLKAWSQLLKFWGVAPHTEKVMGYLQNNAGTRLAPAAHDVSIANFETVKAVLEGHKRFSWMLREGENEKKDEQKDGNQTVVQKKENGTAMQKESNKTVMQKGANETSLQKENNDTAAQMMQASSPRRRDTR